MFTGLIETLGRLESLSRSGNIGNIVIHTPWAGELAQGESLAVDGVCLTVVEFTQNAFTAQISEESWARSTLGQKKVGELVNLERAIQAGARLGGHLVLGHVDAVGELIQRTDADDTAVFRFRYPHEYAAFLVEKGSVAMDGVSLTVAELEGDTFNVAVIPATLKMTTMGEMAAGRMVNLEFDIFGKYVLRALELGKTEITADKMFEWGY